MGSKHRPQRSCVACREKRDKRQLTRVVFVDGGLQADASGKRDGRGAYLCGRRACWALAAKGGLMSKALRRELSDRDRAYLRQMTPS